MKNNQIIPEIMHCAVNENIFWDIVQNGLNKNGNSDIILYKTVEEAKCAVTEPGEKFVFSVLTGAAFRNGTEFSFGDNGTLLAKNINSIYLVRVC